MVLGGCGRIFYLKRKEFSNIERDSGRDLVLDLLAEIVLMGGLTACCDDVYA